MCPRVSEVGTGQAGRTKVMIKLQDFVACLRSLSAINWACELGNGKSWTGDLLLPANRAAPLPVCICVHVVGPVCACVRGREDANSTQGETTGGVCVCVCECPLVISAEIGRRLTAIPLLPKGYFRVMS
ncbi:unnamed protein product [Protopolystoma xenopodis]|uniref:Uncharacterized protein n=1 Tax=Protopolystoma xenopodis TaxID=117903 RepID=A0A3S5ASP8_9PLAT|nr:unnamed protein product [Protopolystoma xenopodis]